MAFIHLQQQARSMASPAESPGRAKPDLRCCDGAAIAGTLARTLDAHGFRLSRLKTGTPPRIDARTVDYSSMERQPTDQDPIPFSFLNMSDASWTPPAQQACLAPILASQTSVGFSSTNVRVKFCMKLTCDFFTWEEPLIGDEQPLVRKARGFWTSDNWLYGLDSRHIPARHPGLTSMQRPLFHALLTCELPTGCLLWDEDLISLRGAGDCLHGRRQRGQIWLGPHCRPGRLHRA